MSKPIHIVICIRTPRIYSTKLRNILRSELIATIEQETRYSVLSSQTEYDETCKIFGIAQMDIQINLLMVIDKGRFITNRASVLRCIVKPFYKTSTILRLLEVSMRRIVKQVVRISDPLGIDTSITYIRIVRRIL